MVARINSSKSIQRVLNYNEQKVQKGTAECIAAVHFLKDVNNLNFYDKLRHFQRLQSLNERAKTNTVHISLNFPVSEVFETEKLQAIAQSYMDKIGFGEQPFLLYRHTDAGHPHVHIVTTNIQWDGSRIALHNIGRDLSEKARKEVECQFGLIKADESQKIEAVHPVNPKRVLYAKGPTKQAIANVLAAVINHYWYTSLPELNAVLGLYNVRADRGEPGSRTYKTGGLTYSVIDERGNKVGTGVKASAFFFRPTYQFLQQKFTKNEDFKKAALPHLKAQVNWLLVKQKKGSVTSFSQQLKQNRIDLVIRKNKDGFIYGLTYVDHASKCIYNGSELGKELAAKAVQERFEDRPASLVKEPEKPANQNTASIDNGAKMMATADGLVEVIEAVIAPEADFIYTPYQFKKRKKKSKRKQN